MKISAHRHQNQQCSIFNNYLKLVGEIEESNTLQPLEQSKLRTLKKLLKKHRCNANNRKYISI